VNYVTAHDGFTLHDLVSHEYKHNEANGEDNRDGADQTHAWNCGVEGPTQDPAVRNLRRQQTRNLLATLLLSQGVPMILAGDEIGRTQRGNNNAYCQDNELSWIDWSSVDEDGRSLLTFTRRLIALRKKHRAFHQSHFFSGAASVDSPIKDITWFASHGREMGAEDWNKPDARSLAFLLSGAARHYHVDAGGRPEQDDAFFVILNASDESIHYALPDGAFVAAWQLLFETATDGEESERSVKPSDGYVIAPRSMACLVSQGDAGSAPHFSAPERRASEDA
jgi:glycogen operon protein